jgi:hypothetical protein
MLHHRVGKCEPEAVHVPTASGRPTRGSLTNRYDTRRPHSTPYKWRSGASHWNARRAPRARPEPTQHNTRARHVRADAAAPPSPHVHTKRPPMGPPTQSPHKHTHTPTADPTHDTPHPHIYPPPTHTHPPRPAHKHTHIHTDTHTSTHTHTPAPPPSRPGCPHTPVPCPGPAGRALPPAGRPRAPRGGRGCAGGSSPGPRPPPHTPHPPGCHSPPGLAWQGCRLLCPGSPPPLRRHPQSPRRRHQGQGPPPPIPAHKGEAAHWPAPQPVPALRWRRRDAGRAGVRWWGGDWKVYQAKTNHKR